MLADVVVSASILPEPFGRTVIEAQAMARPVVATDHGGAAETVEHLVTGWRVPPGDPAALAQALDHALQLTPSTARPSASAPAPPSAPATPPPPCRPPPWTSTARSSPKQ